MLNRSGLNVVALNSTRTGPSAAWSGTVRSWARLAGACGAVARVNAGISLLFAGAGSPTATLAGRGACAARHTVQGSLTGALAAGGNVLARWRLQGFSVLPAPASLFNWTEGRAFRVVRDPRVGGIAQGGIERTEIIKNLQEI